MAVTETRNESHRVAFHLDELVIDCLDPGALAGFWLEALGYRLAESEDEMASIEDPSGEGPDLCFQKVPEAKLGKNRVHFDLNIGEDDLDEAVRRLLDLGARKVDVGQAPDCSWAVLADPEGNEFCVVS